MKPKFYIALYAFGCVYFSYSEPRAYWYKYLARMCKNIPDIFNNLNLQRKVIIYMKSISICDLETLGSLSKNDQ